MQIDRLNHLMFPPDNHAPGAGLGSARGEVSTGTPPLRARSAPPTLRERIEPPPLSTVVKIGSSHSPDDPIAAIAVATAAAVYAKPGSTPPVAAAAPDLAQQQSAYNQAVARQAAVATQITLDKDGVMVAKPHAMSSPPPSVDALSSQAVSGYRSVGAQSSFVSLAVSAMREFNDEADRQKRFTPTIIPQSSDMSTGPAGPLRGLQQLASRLHRFA